MLWCHDRFGFCALLGSSGAAEERLWAGATADQRAVAEGVFLSGGNNEGQKMGTLAGTGSFDLSNTQDTQDTQDRGGFPLRHKDSPHASLPSQGTYKLIISHMSPMPRALASQSHP